MKTLATYHRTDAAPKVFAYRLNEKPGTIDLLDAEGEVVVGECPVVEDPETCTGKLPDGYATLDGADSAGPTGRTGRAGRTKKAAE